MPKAKILLLVIVGAMLFIGGYGIGLSVAERREAGDLAWLKPQIEDAIRRWALKTRESEADVRRHWSPRAMFLPIHNQASGNMCIQLKLERGAAGDSPVYCYQDFSTVLVAEYSDVE